MGLSKTFLALGIAIVFAAFVSYGINIIYEPPPHDYSGSDCHLKYDCYKPVSECEDMVSNTTKGTPADTAPSECYVNISRTSEYKECMHAQEKCSEEFTRQSPQYSHARNTFFIMLFIGLAAIVGGSRLTKFEGAGSGFIGGGVLVILFAIIQSGIYVYSLDKYIKLPGLGIALAVWFISGIGGQMGMGNSASEIGQFSLSKKRALVNKTLYRYP